MAFGDFTVVRSTVKYVTDASGDLAQVAVNTPAFEFNADGSYKGLLVEPAGTNSIRNNTGVGAVAGTPGTLPTNWSELLAGLTREVVATGTENGVEYVDVRISGTSTGTISSLRFESTTQIVASNGQTWTESAYLKIVAQPNPPTNYQLYMFERTSLGVFIKSATQTVTPTSTLTRFSFTRALDGGATVGAIQPAIRFTTSIGSTYDFTIRIGLPQMETGAVATSVIKTSGTALTRTADSVTLTGASSLIGQSANTLYVEGEILTFTGASDACIMALTDGTSDEAIVIRTIAADGKIGGVVRDGGSDQADITSSSFTTGLFKIAIASAVDDVALYLNGSSVGTDTSATHPALTAFQLGGTVATVAPTARPMWLRAIATFPSRIANAQLESLTTL